MPPQVRVLTHTRTERSSAARACLKALHAHLIALWAPGRPLAKCGRELLVHLVGGPCERCEDGTPKETLTRAIRGLVHVGDVAPWEQMQLHWALRDGAYEASTCEFWQAPTWFTCSPALCPRAGKALVSTKCPKTTKRRHCTVSHFPPIYREEGGPQPLATAYRAMVVILDRETSAKTRTSMACSEYSVSAKQ
jgi:hypothetical protein